MVTAMDTAMAMAIATAMEGNKVFFNFHFSFFNSGLLSGSTDIHCHLLPHVDDGAKDYNEAVSVLRWLKKTGIERLYLTPHVMSDFPKNTGIYLTEKFEQFTKRMENDEITDIPALKLGAEYMLEATFNIRKEESLLTYAGRHILVETSYLTPPLGFRDLLDSLIADGNIPILAHPERYIYMDWNDYQSFKAQKVKYQLNYLSLTGVYGTHAQKTAAQLLKEGLYDYAGSDIHHLGWHRKNLLLKKLTKKQITQLRPLFQNNRQLW